MIYETLHVMTKKDSKVEDPWMNLPYMLKNWAKISGLSEDGETKSSEVEK